MYLDRVPRCFRRTASRDGLASILSKGGRCDINDDEDDDEEDDGIDRSKWINASARMLELQRLIDPVFHKQYTQNAPAINSNQYPGARMVNP
jgi:hypothetical protein